MPQEIQDIEDIDEFEYLLYKLRNQENVEYNLFFKLNGKWQYLVESNSIQDLQKLIPEIENKYNQKLEEMHFVKSYHRRIFIEINPDETSK